MAPGESQSQNAVTLTLRSKINPLVQSPKQISISYLWRTNEHFRSPRSYRIGFYLFIHPVAWLRGYCRLSLEARRQADLPRSRSPRRRALNQSPIQSTASNPNLKEVVMTQTNNNTPIIKPEIVAPPSVSNLSVVPVGTGMFSVTMQVIMVVRFPTDAPAGAPMVISADNAIPQTPVIASTTAQAATGELIYGNGELPNAFDGVAEGFQAFMQVHGYIPPTREVLIQWATTSQGGA